MNFIHKAFNDKNCQYNNVTDYIHKFQVSHSYYTRINDVRLPSIRIKMEKQSVIHQELELWNSASVSLKTLNCEMTFERLYKTCLLSKY